MTVMPESLRNQRLLTAVELNARLGEFYTSLQQFNDGWYFESHETLEDLWMVTPFPEREMFQGIIQAAAAFVHLVRAEYPGVVKLLDAAIEKLSRAGAERFGVDLAGFVSGLRLARDEISELGPERFGEWDERRVPKIAFDRPEHFAGIG
jgi:predicted metal-dependent hydrolase